MLIAAGLVAVPIVANNWIFANARALGNPLGGEGRFWSWREGDVFYAHEGNGDHPLVLLHGLYAGASMFEWRKNFGPLAEHFHVYAPDWLGFGISDKPKIRYTDELYVEMLLSFIRNVVGKPCTLVATTHAAPYAIEAAKELGDMVEGLALVCPTGMKTPGDEDKGMSQELRYAMLNVPVLGTSIYNGIASVASLRAYLQNNVYFDPSYATDEVVEYYSASTHQYGSQYAPYAFVSGMLGHSVRESLPELTQKNIRIIWGREARITPLTDAEAYLAANPHAELSVLDRCGMLPQDEQAVAFNSLIVETFSPATNGSDRLSNGRGKDRKKATAS
jgi:pimeloyl-ACP methyl ester carboxylesterase